MRRREVVRSGAAFLATMMMSAGASARAQSPGGAILELRSPPGAADGLVRVGLDGRIIGALGPDCGLRVALAPGAHRLTLHRDRAVRAHAVRLAPGETARFRITPGLGLARE